MGTEQVDVGDPKLRRVRAQIEALLHEEDIGGTVLLHNATPEGSGGCFEVFHHLEPSYSVVRIIRDGTRVEVRIKSKLSDYGGNKARMNHDRAATANMLSGFCDLYTSVAAMMIQVSQIVDEAVGAEHDPQMRHTPDPRETH